MRPDVLAAHLDRTLSKVRELTGVSLAFGGPVDGEGVLLNRFSGPVVGPLSGVKLDVGCGVGGKAAVTQLPVVVSDYVESRTISHQYDAVVRAEKLRSMAAVPVVVGRQTVAVVYGAQRSPELVGGRSVETLVREVRALEQQLAVERALEEVRAITLDDVFRENQKFRHTLRELHTDLRRIAMSTPDAPTQMALQDRLRMLGDTQRSDTEPTALNLTSRELDVLTVAATGATNSDIADCLNLTTHTIKSYMKIIMNKLDASTRHEAVNVARRAGAIL